MKILLLGGTQFLGRAIAEAALERGHTLTLFNRGQHNPDVFPTVERLRGDRDGGLDVLRNRSWDAVVDTCGYVPRIVRASAELLAPAVDQYVFISTISVYAQLRELGVDEGGPLGTLKDPSVETVTGDTYGPLKVLCEQAVEAACPGKALIIRPGLIVGPHDPTDRFSYWPVRIARGGEVLAPNAPDMHSQIIDVRDLAEWTIKMVEQRATGIYNATGPKQPLTLQQILEACQSVTASNARITWADEAWLEANNVEPWVGLPLWLPVSSDPDLAGFGDVSIVRAIGAGLRFRPLETTIRDTLVWANTRPTDHTWRAGLTPERERELLIAWRNRAAG